MYETYSTSSPRNSFFGVLTNIIFSYHFLLVKSNAFHLYLFQCPYRLILHSASCCYTPENFRNPKIQIGNNPRQSFTCGFFYPTPPNADFLTVIAEMVPKILPTKLFIWHSSTVHTTLSVEIHSEILHNVYVFE